MDQERVTDAARAYYDAKKADRNYLIGSESGYVNHHFGIGQGGPEGGAAEIHRLEMAQIEALLDRMEPVATGARVLDAGCGRGGTAFRIAQRFGANVDGVNISAYQVDCARVLASRHGLEDRVRFEVRSYYDLAAFPGTYDHVVTNETTLYARDLERLFRGFRSALKPGGGYTIATWCLNEEQPQATDLVDAIAEHYRGRMHRRADYLSALSSAGFSRCRVDDVTAEAIPYWETRKLWDRRSGIEDAFLEGHRDRKILYLFISATA